MKKLYILISILIICQLVITNVPISANANQSKKENAYKQLTNKVSSFECELTTSPIAITNHANTFSILQYSNFKLDGLGFLRGYSVAVGGHYGKGRYIAFSHEGHFSSAFDGQKEIDLLRKNILSWLGDKFWQKSIGFTHNHQEWLTIGNFSNDLKEWCLSNEVKLQNVNQTEYGAHDMIVVGNPWKELAAHELEAIEKYVESGGGVLVLGLGWSWASYTNDDSCVNLPVNALGRYLGFAFEGLAQQDKYIISNAVQQYVVINADGKADQDLTNILSSNSEAALALEGQYVVLHLPNQLWKKVSSPKRTIAVLDSIYKKAYDFIEYLHPPHDVKLWFVVNYSSESFMYADYDHCGMSLEGANHFVDNLNRDTSASIWGVGHEVGHTMVNSTYGALFQPTGTDESWCNILNIYAFKEIGLLEYALKEAERFSSDYSGDDGKYDYLNGDYDSLTDEYRNFDILQTNPWIFIKLPLLIIENYGWDGMRLLFETAAQDTYHGIKLASDAEKTEYMIVNLSRAYNVDFSSLFEHWKFPVDDAIKAQLDSLPKDTLILNSEYINNNP